MIISLELLSQCHRIIIIGTSEVFLCNRQLPSRIKKKCLETGLPSDITQQHKGGLFIIDFHCLFVYLVLFTSFQV